ncbi:MAG: DNA-binding protein [Prevotella sp.]|jgi:predicted histone-like DNA-binding protein|nr:DNA-binding protein [Prevotella sp.]
MAFFKKVKMKVRTKTGETVDLWYPRSVLVGKTVSTEQLSTRVAQESTVSPPDVLAVLKALSGCMGDYMSMGRSVKLDGIGSFYYSASAAGNGAASEEDCSANAINGVLVRFLPETKLQRTPGSGRTRHAVRPLIHHDVEWIDVATIVTEPTDDGE